MDTCNTDERRLLRESVRLFSEREVLPKLSLREANGLVPRNLHGGMGCLYECEVEVERHYRDSRVLGIGGGANESMTETIAKLLMPRPA